jgi:hypothetical protein
MNHGLWTWPSGPRGQQTVLRKVAANTHLMAALNALAKTKDGLSNAELDDAIGDSSEWMTLWVIRQLTSLGFIEFKVDFFGGPAKYQLTDMGRNAFSTLTGKPPPKPVPIPTPPPAAQPLPQPPAPTPKAV